MDVRVIQRKGCAVRYADYQQFELDIPISEPLAEAISLRRRKTAPPFSGNSFLVEAGTGTGKTRTILEAVIPFSAGHGLSVCFVSSRAAINTQFKRSLAHTLGRSDILSDYTPQGLQHLFEIGPVHILTYHALWQAMCREEPWIKAIDVLVFDEIHALTLDALFVPFTGRLLKRIPSAFRRAARIYLTATSAPIRDELLRVEGDYQLTFFRWPINYGAYQLHFFSSIKNIIWKLNSLPDDQHALVFVNSISEGERIAGQLKRSHRLISSKTKEQEPEVWSRLLETGTLDSQVLLATTTLDAGVSLTDPALQHIFCTGVNAASVIQQAGRKRLKCGEKLNLYLWSPGQQKLGQLFAKNGEMREALTMSTESPYQFLDEFILGDRLPQVRKMCLPNRDQTISVNPLALEYFCQKRDLLQELLHTDDPWPMDAYWAKVFGQDLPTDPQRWLDDRHDSTAEEELRQWLEGQVGRNLATKEDKDIFGREFKSKYQRAFGRRINDRSDRQWGKNVLQKVLSELDVGIQLISISGGWRIERSSRESFDAQADNISM